MSQINRPPLGLQQLLGSQNFGDNPDDLGQVVQPTVELFPFYAAGAMKMKHTAGGRTTAGIISTVPIFGAAAIIGVSVRRELMGVAELLNIGITMDGLNSVGASASKIVLASTGPITYGIGVGFGLNYTFPQPLIVESGAQFNSEYFGYNGNIEFVTLTVLYYDLAA